MSNASVQKVARSRGSSNTRASSSSSSPRPSDQYESLQFRMPPEFVRAYKQVALDRGMKLNELFVACFQHYVRQSS